MPIMVFACQGRALTFEIDLNGYPVRTFGLARGLACGVGMQCVFPACAEISDERLHLIPTPHPNPNPVAKSEVQSTGG